MAKLSAFPVTLHRVKFAKWVQKRYPAAWAKIAFPLQAGLGDGDFSPDLPPTPETVGSNPGFFQSLIDNLPKAVAAVAQYKSQSALIDLNIQRAKNGLPPVDSASIAPTANVGVGISAGSQQIVYAGLGLVALLGLLWFAKRH